MKHPFFRPALLACCASAALGAAAQQAAEPAAAPSTAPRAAPAVRAAPSPALKPCQSVKVDEPTYLTLGKSQVIRLDFPAARMMVGGAGTSPAGRATAATAAAPAPAGRPAGAGAAGVADTEITLLSPTELFFLGRKSGAMNVVLQSADGRCVVKDLIVTVDPATLQSTIGQIMPGETGVRVRAAEDTIVLTGTVSDPVHMEQVLALAGAYGDGKKVVNFMRVGSAQQVMLEVKIAEVSKTLLDSLGLDFSRLVTSAGGLTSSIISGIIGGGAAALGRFSGGGGVINGSAAGSVGGRSGAATANFGTTSRGATLLGIDAQKKDGIVRVLAEPNIMAISGQASSFLSGGKIFIPVAQSNGSGGSTITLEEKEFGVGLRFTPTVLDGTRINLKLVSEVSELSQAGSPFTSVNGVTSVLPSMTTRRVDTTVQLLDGQSFVVAGLIKNNLTQALDKFPGLGDAPVLGALFRSTEFQTDQTELMFVITARLVKPLAGPVTLPTDNHIAPTPADAFMRGKSEGSPGGPTR
ncbi:type II and III secretion system protein family protein [Ramlibacter sp. PS4R-6]|uniref:type II and III secretion system protein family protein n=1 Tax=Ramlibacter sp. PS4R-6 TaxID=3133438 RepID=UPI003094A75D